MAPSSSSEHERNTTMPREFNLEGEWQAFQSNGWTATFFLTQDIPLPPAPADQRTKLSGSARAVHPDVGLIHADTVSGRVDRGPGCPVCKSRSRSIGVTRPACTPAPSDLTTASP